MKKLSDLNGAIYLFPFTVEAAIALQVLRDNGYEVSGIFDNSERLKGKIYEDVNFFSPSSDADIVIICGYKHYEKAKMFRQSILFDELITFSDFEKAYPKINQALFCEIAPRQRIRIERFQYEIDSYLFDDDGREIEYSTDGIVLSQVQVCVTTKCTLRCRDCTDLMQYYAQPYHVPFASVIRDIEMLFSKVHFIRVLGIYGGETFLYPHFAELLDWLNARRDKFGMINTAVNGTVMPSDDLCRALRSTKAVVMISDYGAFSIRKNDIINKLREKEVFCQTMQFQKDIKWYPYGRPVYDINESDTELDEKFLNCSSRLVCNHLYRGKFYYCAFIAHMEELFGIPYHAKNSIDLSVTDKQTLQEYVLSQKYVDACRYCTSTAHTLEGFEPAIQMKGTLQCKNFSETYVEKNQ